MLSDFSTNSFTVHKEIVGKVIETSGYTNLNYMY